MARPTFTIYTSVLFDPKKKEFIKNVSIDVDPGKGTIAGLVQRSSEDLVVLEAGDIDLRGKVVMPGFVDSHTHIFLHSYDERSSTEQMRDESVVERVVRATNHVRNALLAGYTTYRDLGSEALSSADANLRDCINRGLIPGPRLFVATDAVASSGSYEVRSESTCDRLVVPRASDVGDGTQGVKSAVRRRVGAGCDVIKFYADYRRKTMRFPEPRSGIRFLPTEGDPNPVVPLFQQEEMDAIVAEAKLAELPVAAHAGEPKAALMAARAGVTSIEHMFESTDEVFDEMRRRGCIWVPTLTTAENLAPAEWFTRIKDRVKIAHEAGVRLAAGGDTGTFNHGLNAREMEIMIEAGIPLEDVLESCTVGGWEACGGKLCGYKFGWFEEGNRADIIALDADPREDRKALRKVSFVMKDGRVWKHDGVPVGMFATPRWPEEADEPSDSDSDWTELVLDEDHEVLPVPSPVYKPRK